MKHKIFRKFLKLVIKLTFFNDFCPKINYFYFIDHVHHCYGVKLEFQPFLKLEKKLEKKDKFIRLTYQFSILSPTANLRDGISKN